MALRRSAHPVLSRSSRGPAAVSPEPIQPLPEPVDATRHLDPRVWLVWLAAVIVPALAGRNPFPLVALLIVVVVVRSAWAPALARDTGWALIVRLVVIASVISVIFNVLTAPFGDQVLLDLPGWWPLGDVVTANAFVYGLLSAIAIVIIILAGTTVGSLADWPALLRSVPARFLPLAVAGSVAWAFVPQTIGTLHDIRDAQRVRGITVASARTLVPIIVPLLATSLERATTMAEALEARGFGGSAALPQRGGRRAGPWSIVAPSGLALSIAGIYLLLDGSPQAGAGVTVAGVVLITLTLARGGRDPRSRYRRRVWRRRDTAVLAASLLSLAVTGLSLIATPLGLRYSPYPRISLPAVDIPLILALGLLLAPAVVAPLVPVRRASVQSLLHPAESDGPDSPDAVGVLTASSPEVVGRIHRSSTARPVPWASWPSAFRSEPAPRRRRLRAIAVNERVAVEALGRRSRPLPRPLSGSPTCSPAEAASARRCPEREQTVQSGLSTLYENR